MSPKEDETDKYHSSKINFLYKLIGVSLSKEKGHF